MQLDPIEGEFKNPYGEEKKKPKHKVYTKIVCPNCSEEVQSDNLNLAGKIAKCGSCNSIFSFQNELEELLNPQDAITQQVDTHKAKKPKVGNQKDVDIYEYEGDLSIDVVDYNDILALSASFVCLPMIPIGIGMITETGNYLPLVIGVLLFIFAVKYRENKSFIDVDDTHLRISSTQKYFYRKKEYLRSSIRQFYTKANPNGGGYYNVFMIYDGPEGEEHIKITPITKSRSRSLYVEQSLESFLNIEDKIVAEETPF
jgi:Zn-finger nucleic acid-binding protein